MLVGLGPCGLAFGDNPNGRCAWCGAVLAGRRRRWCSAMCADAWGENHIWTAARWAAIRRDGGCVTCGARHRLEVNHIVPRDAAGYRNGCHHHQDGLETLCHAHHVEETNRQRRARRDGLPLPARMAPPVPTLF